MLMFGSWGVLGLIFVGGTLTSGTSAGFSHALVTPGGYFRTQLEVIPHYLGLALLPVGQCFDYMWQEAASWAQVWPGGLLLVSIALVGLGGLIARQWWGAVVCAFFFVLGPSSSFIPISDYAAEHRMYLPLVCVIVVLLGLVVSLMRRLPEVVRSPMLVAGVVTGLAISTVLAGMTLSRNMVYSSRHALWSDVVNHPLAAGNHRALNNLAMPYFSEGDYIQARHLFREAIAIEPGFKVARLNLGEMDYLAGQYEEAAAVLARPDQFGKTDQAHRRATMRTWAALSYEAMGDREAARTFLQAAVRISPEHERAHVALGELAWRDGAVERAREHFEHVLDREPEHLAAAVGLSRCLLGQGDSAGARALLQRVLGDADAGTSETRSVNAEVMDIGQQLAMIDAAGLEDWLAGAEPVTGIDTHPMRRPSVLRSQAHMLLSAIARAEGDEPGYQHHLAQALAADPLNDEALSSRAERLHEAGARADAMTLMVRAVWLEPRDVERRFMLATWLHESGRHADALPHALRVVGDQPDHRSARLLAVYLLAASPDVLQRDPVMAWQLLEPVMMMDDDPDDPVVLDLASIVHAAMGEWDDARRFASRAMAEARARQRDDLVMIYERRLALYEAGLPFVLPAGDND